MCQSSKNEKTQEQELKIQQSPTIFFTIPLIKMIPTLCVLSSYKKVIGFRKSEVVSGKSTEKAESIQFSRDMWFPTMRHFDMCRLRRACAAPFYA